MEFLTQHIIPPTAHYLDLLQLLSVVVTLIHVPYVGMVIGGVGAAMWFTLAEADRDEARYGRLAGDLLDVFLGNRAAVFVLGVFPLLVLTFAYAQWFVGTDAPPLRYIPASVIPILAGFGFLGLYRRTFASRACGLRRHLARGSVGVVLLLSGYFVLIASIVRLQDPEKWFRVKSLGVMLLNWNAVWKFMFFLHASFALTGCAILFFFFRWPGTKLRDAGTEYSNLVRNFGAGMAFVFTLSLPVYYLFYIFTTADIALDNSVYAVSVVIVAVTMLVAALLVPNLKSERTRFAAPVFVLFLVIVLLVGVVDQKTMGNANLEHKTYKVLEAKQRESERRAHFEELLATGAGVGRGKQIFTGQCMACHRFDTKLVGPPLQTVLPKYKDDVEALRAFIKSPSKKNAGYPPMPSLGLSSNDIEAVADYVLEELDNRSPE